MRISLTVALAAMPLLCCAPAGAAEPTQVAQDFTQLSLEELLNVQVTSVSKHAEPLRRAAGAVTVITGDELRRAGSRTLAQALRLVPELQVYRTNAQAYTVTSRGFSGDKLEVLVDGRSVYSPLTSTVFWDVLDTFLADVERIEVIRGPGATLWGANAVNGVINIVTRSARDTTGTVVTAGGGAEEKAHGAFRSGSKIGGNGHGRVYAKAFERDASIQRDGTDTFDGQRQGQVGFRTDWVLTGAQDLTVSGDFYKGRQTTRDFGGGRGADAEVQGQNVAAHWTWHESRTSDLSVLAYYDGYTRLVPQTFADRRDTGNVELQAHLRTGALTWTSGLGARISHDETGGPPLAIIFEPASRTLETYNAFVQAQYALTADLEVTAGAKVEYNTYTDVEVQPGLRLGWAVGESVFTWASVARAVRLPNRVDQDLALFCSGPIVPLLGCTPNTRVRIGNPDFEAEELIAYEWGLRFWTGGHFSADLATFYFDYDDLRSTETSPPPIGSFANNTEAISHGAALALGWTPLSWLNARAHYGLLEIEARADAGSTDAYTAANLEGGSPRHSAGLQLGVTPWPRITLDAFLRYVDELPRQQVPAYSELNLRLGWKPVPTVDVVLSGSNLLHDSHAEAGTAPSPTTPAPPPPQTEIERAVWLDVTWRWQ